MPPWVRPALRWILGDYCAYHIYTGGGTVAAAPLTQGGESSGTATSTRAPSDTLSLRPVGVDEIRAAKDGEIADSAWYGGAQSRAFACFAGERLVACCYYWYGERYRTRNFWPLADGQAKLVQITTVADMRGRGLACRLIRYSAAQLHADGFVTLYARIWHSNTPSIRAFERAGWRRIALVLEVEPLGLGRRLRHVQMVRGGPA